MINDRHSLMKALIAAALFGCAFGFSGTAHASATFPGKVKEHLKLSCVPQCTLCHTANPGESSTFGGPFGAQVAGARVAVSQAVQPPDFSPEAIGAALENIRAKGLAADADKNGVNDVVDIESGSNPNLGGEPVCGPMYGCGAHVAPQSPFSNWGTLLAGVFVGGVGLARIRFRKVKHGEKA